MQERQAGIRRKANYAGLRIESLVESIILVRQAVILAESEQWAKLQPDDAGLAGAFDFILHDGCVLALYHENSLLDPHAMNFKRENREGIKPKLFQIAISGGVYNILVLIRGQIKRVAVDDNRLLQLGKQNKPTDW